MGKRERSMFELTDDSLLSSPGVWNLRIRRFNRAVLNPIMLQIASHLRRGYPAVVRHVGRESGRGYRTPVVAEPIKDDFIIPLPYGTDTDWFRNVQTAGRCVIDRAGQTFDVVDPVVIGPDEALPLVSDRLRRAWQRYHIEHFVRVRSRDGQMQPMHIGHPLPRLPQEENRTFTGGTRVEWARLG